MSNEEQVKYIEEQNQRRREEKVIAIATIYHQQGMDLDGQVYEETVEAIRQWPDERIETEYYKLTEGNGDAPDIGEDLVEEETEIDV